VDEREIHSSRAFVAHNQAPEVAEPREGAFHDPAAPVSPQRTTVLCWWSDAVDSMRTDELDASLGQPFPQRITVVSPIGYDAIDPLPGSARTTAWNRDAF
jgi:hypothetical protein